MKHQLNIHLDYWGFPHSGGRQLQIRFGYPHNQRHTLREQVMTLHEDTFDAALRVDLDTVYGSLVRRIPGPEAVRLPHAEITPTITPAILTFVVLDQKRAALLPMARLYYYEEVEALQSRIEGQVRLEKPDWTSAEMEVCERIRHTVRKLAWQEYERLVSGHLYPQ